MKNLDHNYYQRKATMAGQNDPRMQGNTGATGADDFDLETDDEEMPRPPEFVRLIDDHSSGEPDIESELIADAVAQVGLASPEEAAMRVKSESDTDFTGRR